MQDTPRGKLLLMSLYTGCRLNKVKARVVPPSKLTFTGIPLWFIGTMQSELPSQNQYLDALYEVQDHIPMTPLRNLDDHGL